MRARKVDENQASIRDAWIASGGSWLSLCPEHGGEPDALVGRDGYDLLIEVKRPLGKRGGSSGKKLRPNQVEWHASWKGRAVVVVRDLSELLRAFHDFTDDGSP